MYLYLKAVHIIFVVNWFAGLFYMPRLFIYATEANEKPEPERSIIIEQLKIMQQRLWYIITWPSCIITLCAGIWLLLKSGFMMESWMHLKLLFVVFLLGYHFSLHVIYKMQQSNMFLYSSTQLRIWNEVATILLFAIVFLVVVKTNLSWLTGLLGLFILVVVLMIGIRLYKRIRGQ